MDFARRIALLRVTALVAIAASAVLTVDHLDPGRAFCPLEEACAAARESALGSIAGVPTSILGMGAFGLLLLLSLLPLEWSRPVLRPAGALAALAGLGFIAYQELVLGSFCPLCLVADTAGFAAGLLLLTWPRLPVRRSGRRIRWEGAGGRMAWSLASVLAALAPFAVPRPQDPGWEAITPLAESAFEDPAPTQPAPPVERDPAPQEPLLPPPAEPTRSAPLPPALQDERLAVAAPSPGLVDARGQDAAAPDGDEPARLRPPQDPGLPRARDVLPEPQGPDGDVPDAPAEAPQPEVRTRPRAEHPQPTSPSGPPAPSRLASQPPSTASAPLLVEYLNAFCAHCRATHGRLQRVLAESPTPFRRKRVYTWAGSATPLWARACAYGAAHDAEDRVFAELLQARHPTLEEVCGAVRRAGLSVRGFNAWLRRSEIAPRLLRDRALVQRARLRRLPTIDIGRRRLSGAQSEAELRAAVEAAAR